MEAITKTKSWQDLQAHYQKFGSTSMRDLFSRDKGRFEQFSCQAAGLFLDYSKNRIDADGMQLLMKLAEQAGLQGAIESMFSGEIINSTEQRAVLHTALRSREATPITVDDENVREPIAAALKQMEAFVTAVRKGKHTGYTGKKIRDVINVGIGGSDLGPAMAYHALSEYTGDVRCHYVSLPDNHAIKRLLKTLDPETTLVLIVSKTFTTQETLTNADAVKDWLANAAGDVSRVSAQLCAVTSNVKAAIEYGVAETNVFPMWDWVGGRFSLWSAVGLSVALAIGIDNFKKLLSGACEMDVHFRTSDFSNNMPVIMGLLGVWYQNFFHAHTQAIIPYTEALSLLPDYLQQLCMESLGKRVRVDGAPVDYETGAILWGGVGTNSQHSFHQLLMQGSHLIPIDFILPADKSNPLMLAHCLAQSRTLMEGFEGKDNVHKTIPGNSPSNTLLMDGITPETLGALIALYEHKVLVQSVVWGINAFDQWGVERGKKMANTLLPAVESGKLPDGDVDGSTTGLLTIIAKGL